jgi:hypothetical protein
MDMFRMNGDCKIAETVSKLDEAKILSLLSVRSTSLSSVEASMLI